MTVRLIALMSAVLLLSLAAMVLVMDHFQEGVMSELEKTVSMVGKETIRSLEGAPAIRRRAGSGPASGHQVHRVLVRREKDGVVVSEDVRPVEVIARTGPGPGAAGAATGTSVFVSSHSESEPGASLPGEADRTFIVRLEDVTTEADAERGLLLRIPTLPGSPAADRPRVATTTTLTTTSGPAAAGSSPGTAGSNPAGRILEREILLPIPTRHYQELFAGMRRKSALVFLAVFIAGAALLATVASRFTRPIRKLDAGIRRLSEGDLETRVDVTGGGEVGRLGRAFNEMAQKLRLGRDRARELTRKEKLAALGRLASGVAHDVRNPLHSIGLTLQHIHETCRPDEEEARREFDRSLGLIRDEIRRLDRLVSNFLSFAKSGGRERGPVDLRELIQDIARLIEKEAERREVGVELALDGDAVPAVLGEAEAIRASVLNLVLNSLEAMDSGGTLRLTLSGAPGEVRLEVADTGRGIPAAEQDKVFEFAYSTREGGTGLGLAMVHQVVVEDHGGRVELESRPGEGTRVTLGFPLSPVLGGARA